MLPKSMIVHKLSRNMLEAYLTKYSGKTLTGKGFRYKKTYKMPINKQKTQLILGFCVLP